MQSPSNTQTNDTQDIKLICTEMEDVMSALTNLLEAETRLLKAGKSDQAGRLVAEKNKRAFEYQRLAIDLTRNVAAIDKNYPVVADRLNRKHATMRKAMEQNLNIVGAVKEVTDKLLHEIADASTPRESSDTYGKAKFGSHKHKIGATPLVVNKKG